MYNLFIHINISTRKPVNLSLFKFLLFTFPSPLPVYHLQHPPYVSVDIGKVQEDGSGNGFVISGDGDRSQPVCVRPGGVHLCHPPNILYAPHGLR